MVNNIVHDRNEAFITFIYTECNTVLFSDTVHSNNGTLTIQSLHNNPAQCMTYEITEGMHWYIVIHVCTCKPSTCWGCLTIHLLVMVRYDKYSFIIVLT